MDRRKFIKKAGGAAVAGIIVGCCGGGCTSIDNPIIPNNNQSSNVDFIIDLNDPEYSALNTNGNFIIIDDKYVIAKSINGEYIAATRTCSHEGYNQIIYNSDENQWVCNQHLAAFNLQGEGTTTFEQPPLNVNPTFNDNGLTIYQTELINNSILRIFS